MTESDINQILRGFTGEEKHDIEYFLTLYEKYKEDQDSKTIYNAMLNKLYDNLSPETKAKFVVGLKEKGLGHLIKPASVEFHSLSRQDVVEVKKFIVGNSTGYIQKPLDFDEAVMVEKPFVMSLPQEVVERIKKQRKEWIEKNDCSE